MQAAVADETLEISQGDLDFELGAGVVHVNATESLTAEVTGAGQVLYRGDPNVEVNVSAAGASTPSN